MYCRSRPQYRSDLGWISGVAFLGTLTRSARPVQGFTFVRCCSMPPASSPHGLAAPGLGRLTTAIPACSCLQLAVATNSLRRGLPPPIQCPCLAHQGCSLRSHRLRRLKPLTPTLSPATHSAMPSMLPCCTSDLKRRMNTIPLARKGFPTRPSNGTTAFLISGKTPMQTFLGQRFRGSNHIRRPRQACRTKCG